MHLKRPGLYPTFSKQSYEHPLLRRQPPHPPYHTLRIGRSDLPRPAIQLQPLLQRPLQRRKGALTRTHRSIGVFKCEHTLRTVIPTIPDNSEYYLACFLVGVQ